MDQLATDVNLQSRAMILAGDVGGTKTRIGLFVPRDGRPAAIDVQSFPTPEYGSLPAIVDAYFETHEGRDEVSAAAFGVAGPVIGGSAQMTNVEWRVDAAEIAAALGIRDVRLLNDLEAMAHAVPVLTERELHTLQHGARRDEGNMAIIAAGTGLGGALLHRVEDRYLPVASEIGHSDFAARHDRELDFVRFARARFGRVEIEHVLCGPGLVNLAEFTHQDSSRAMSDHGTPPDVPADISEAAMNGTCAACAAALDMFVDAYGAVAGNLALTAVTTAGIFIGGGIAPRILPAFGEGRFIAAFNDKPPMRALLEAMPVHVVLNDTAGLLGAAVYANDHLTRG